MSLASLPTELIETIATHLDLSSSRCLRFVSSSLRQQSLHVFRDLYFRNRSVQWTKKDLDSLVEISGHEAFGTALQHLIINATPKHSISLWQLRKRISEADAIFSESSGLFFKSDLQEQYIAEEKEATEVATFFNETRYDQKCLRAVFARIKRLEKITFEYEGMEKKYGKFGRRYCESSQHEMSRPFVSTMTALAASGTHVREICTGDHFNYGAVSIGRLESLAPYLCNFDAVFEKLERLELNLRDWRYPDTGFELETSRAPFVVRFLAKARNVRHLDIGCYSSLDNDLISGLARHCTFEKLETCKLAYFRVQNASDLFGLLAPSNATLRHLSLSHVVLRDQEMSWADLVNHLASSSDILPGMECLSLSKLFTKIGSRLRDMSLGAEETMHLGAKGHVSMWRDEVPFYTQRFTESASGPAWHLGAVAYPFIGMRT
jgi:hypothetical protein